MIGMTVEALFRPSLGELLDSLAHAEHVLGQMQMAAGFEDGNQSVEIRPGV